MVVVRHMILHASEIIYDIVVMLSYSNEIT